MRSSWDDALAAIPADEPPLVPPLLPPYACWVKLSVPLVEPCTASPATPVVVREAPAPFPPLAPSLPFPPLPAVSLTLAVTEPPPVEIPDAVPLAAPPLPP